MIIALKNAYSVGDLAPDTTFPHVYITTFYVNGPGQTAIINYEIGTMSPPTADTPMGTWVKAMQVPALTLQINGADLYPFFMSQVQMPHDAVPGDDTVDPPIPAQDAISGNLWDQVETLLYQQIQKSDARLEGKFV